jgi:uncharacterized protein YfdQ (DUF2303 family)
MDFDGIEDGGGVRTIAEVVAKLHEVEVIGLERGKRDQADVIAVPSGINVVSIKKFLDEYLPAPERRKGTAVLHDLASFGAHVKRFADSDSVIFANPDPAAAKLTAVIDYHRAGHDSSPRFGEHRAVYTFPMSDEWKAWNDPAVARGMDQKAFAEFVENRIADVISPDKAGQAERALAETLGASYATPVHLMELSRGLAVTVGRKVKNAINLSSGEVEVSFLDEHADASTGKPLKLPGLILLAIPVFRGENPYQVAGRLRYRVTDSGIRWAVDLHRTDVVFRHAFDEAVESVKEATGLPVLLGAPESGS